LSFPNKDNIKTILIEIKGHYIEAFLGKGKRSINTYKNMNDSEELNTSNEKIIINLSAKEYLANTEFISLTFKSQDFLSNIMSFYYFRVIAVKKNESLVYPLDSNFESNCKPIKQSNIDKYYCLFLLKNDYNLFSHNFSFYSSNQYENNYIIYKTIKNEYDNEYTNSLKSLVEDDIFVENSSFQKLVNKKFDNNNYCVLLKFIFGDDGIKTIFPTILDENKSLFPMIYSSQIHQMEKELLMSLKRLSKKIEI
jgi:hypothetical protein